MSPRPRRDSGPTIQRLEAHPERSGGLNLMLCEDRHAGPAETAAARWIWRIGFAVSRRGIGGLHGLWRWVSKPVPWQSDSV